MAEGKDPGYELRSRPLTLSEFVEKWKRSGLRAWRSAQEAGRSLMDEAPEAVKTLGGLLDKSRQGYSDTMRQAPESVRNIKQMKADLERMGRR